MGFWDQVRRALQKVPPAAGAPDAAEGTGAADAPAPPESSDGSQGAAGLSSELVGGQLELLSNTLRLRAMRRGSGLPDPGLSRDHTVLLGLEAGQAETVARRLAGIYCSLGIIRAETVQRMQWTDVAGIEQDAGTWRFQRAVRAASGGILYIEHFGPWQQESCGAGVFAVNLLAELLNMVPGGPLVILAGKEKETAVWLDRHPQVKACVGHYLGPVLTADGLRARLAGLCEGAGYMLSPDAADGLECWYARRLQDRCDVPWDLRDLELTLEKAVRRQAVRLSHASVAMLTDAELVTLRAADFEALSGGAPEQRREAVRAGAAPRPEERKAPDGLLTRSTAEPGVLDRECTGRLRKILTFCGNAQKWDTGGALIVADVDPFDPAEWDVPEFVPVPADPHGRQDGTGSQFRGSPSQGGVLLAQEPGTGQVYSLRMRCRRDARRSVRQDVYWDGSRFCSARRTAAD